MHLDGKDEQVLLRDYQMHPFRQQVQHVDFLRIDPDHKVHMKVALHCINADIAPGVKLTGSSVNHIMTEVEVSCLPKDLPKFIEVDLANLAAGHSIHMSEVKLPSGVEFVLLAHGNDAAVVAIPAPRGGSGDAAEKAE
jgi:large subunit ribosomal protein L25